MTAPRPAPPAAWTRTQMKSGAWRLEHRNGSIIFIARDCTEAEIQRRLAEAEQTIARLARRRTTP